MRDEGPEHWPHTRVPAEPDISLEDPQPHPIVGVEVEAEMRTLKVTYLRGPDRRLHHIEIGMGPDIVRVSLFLGLARWASDGIRKSGGYTTRIPAIQEWTRVQVPEPVALRQVIFERDDPEGHPVSEVSVRPEE